MATTAQAQGIINDLNEKVARFNEAVDALTEASGRLSPPAEPSPQPVEQPAETVGR